MMPTHTGFVSIDFRLTWAEFNEAMAGTLRALELREWDLRGLTWLVARWKFWRNSNQMSVTADESSVSVADEGFDPMDYPWAGLGLVRDSAPRLRGRNEDRRPDPVRETRHDAPRPQRVAPADRGESRPEPRGAGGDAR
jgi:hypothetical protein